MVESGDRILLAMESNVTSFSVDVFFLNPREEYNAFALIKTFSRDQCCVQVRLGQLHLDPRGYLFK